MKQKWGKKLKYFLLAPFLFILLVGCNDQNSTDSSEGVKEIEFFNQKPEISRQLEELANTYSEEHEDVNITITTIGSGEGAAGLQAKFTSGNPPEIMMLGGTSEIDRYQDTLLEVNDLEVTDTIMEDLLEGALIDDSLLAIPMNVEGFGWMYNKEIFKKAGIDPDSIKTFDDFKEAVEQLDSQKEDLDIQEVFAFSGAEDYIANQFSAHFTSPEFDHSILEAYEASELNWEYGDRMKAYTDLFNQYNVQPILGVNYSQSVEELFINNQVAMVHQGNWIVPTLNGIDSDFVDEKLGILPVFGEEDESAKIVAGAPWYIGINSDIDEDVKEVAMDFVDWMYLSDTGQEVLVHQMQLIPPQEGYDVESITDPVSQKIYEEMLNENTSAMAHNQYPDGWFQLVLFPEFQRYLDGYSTWEEFEKNTSEGFKEMREQ
ncbi:MAG TPA: extracellular solute-binding protein [Candidatus Atopostipes pullistercoris]|uniref:Extracellular solute-binding protein n=1 Tax=Candidatus Atopostipes pullistercoris TaxID=2838467 RepID=A0A9D2G2N4_9LACT|nr:extracellular solute-binding protein [Candidatus Atopostipes pullistercoris]